MGTYFSAVYNRFFEKITDDMYMELTPEDTVKDLRKLLIDSIPGFEFPRINLYDYTIESETVAESAISQGEDFILKITTAESDDEEATVTVEKSYFEASLTEEEINILALLMKQAWVQRQVTSIENTRMKYSGSDFKFTSQANHLQKLLSLLEESRRDSFHMQRLYKRRKVDDDGIYQSNWSVLRESSVLG